MKQIEDDMTPFGFIEDGLNSNIQTFQDNSGEIWTVQDEESGGWM